MTMDVVLKFSIKYVLLKYYCKCCKYIDDYRCRNGPTLVSATCVTISNTDSISRSEKWVTPGLG